MTWAFQRYNGGDSMSSPSSRTATAAWCSGLSDAAFVAGEPASVTGVTSDSRQVTKGGLFVAVPGFETDGHKYIG